MGDVTDHADVPLARLLGMAFRQVIDDLHAELATQGWADVRESYGFVLLAVREQATTTTELAKLIGVTKQAMSKQIDAMEEERYVCREVAPADGRVKVIRLAPRGHELLRAVEAIYQDVEARWASVIGRSALERIRSDLEMVLRSRHDGLLPRVRPV